MGIADRPKFDVPLLVADALLGIFSICLIASSNYVINELLDAQNDSLHPKKKLRPVPTGRVNVSLAYWQWLVLMIAGVALGWWVSPALGIVALALWVMGCVYNIRPVRTKDVPYLDVVSEGVNNPLRMLAGWYIAGAALVPPASLLMSYWMVGCYFMALKRFAERRMINSDDLASAYRPSFRHYTENRLLVSVMFYSCASMLFFGAFLMRYRIELLLSFPLVAWVMASYLRVGLRDDSPVQNPEKLYRETGLMVSLTLCVVVMTVLFFVDIPQLALMLQAWQR